MNSLVICLLILSAIIIAYLFYPKLHDNKEEKYLLILSKNVGFDHIPTAKELDQAEENKRNTTDFSNYEECDKYVSVMDEYERIRELTTIRYIHNSKNPISDEEKQEISDFLHTNSIRNVADTLGITGIPTKRDVDKLRIKLMAQDCEDRAAQQSLLKRYDMLRERLFR